LTTKLKRFYRFRLRFTNFRFRLLFFKPLSSKRTLKIYLRLRSNNIFCTLIDKLENKTIFNISSGKYRFNTSKKKLTYDTRMVLKLFLKDINLYLKDKRNDIIIQIISPIRNRRQIIGILSKKFRKINRNRFVIYLKNLKCFNGCRPKKKMRKKRRQLRIFK